MCGTPKQKYKPLLSRCLCNIPYHVWPVGLARCCITQTTQRDTAHRID